MVITLFILAALLLGILWLPNFGAGLTYHLFGISFFTECAFRKGPMVQLIGDNRAVIVWEACRADGDAQLKWNGAQEMQVPGIKLSYSKGTKASVYRAFLAGLPPGKSSYEIQSASSKSSRRYSIAIPPSDAGKLRVVVLGDNQSGYRTFGSMLPKIAATNPNLFLHVGDMVQTSYEDHDWQAYFFDPLRHSGLLSQVPFILTQGNHDMSDDKLAPYFPSLAQLPGRPIGYFYAITIGKTRFIVLDANTEDGDQVKWLERELQSEESLQADFRIVSTHIPPFIEFWNSKTWKKGEDQWPVYMRESMVPLFEEYHVDLVVSGHQHNYQRGQRNGVHYLITGGGGGALDQERVESLGVYQKTIIEHHFTLLDIDEEAIQITMRLKNGQIADRHDIKRKTHLA
ncbi:hypothetical protein PSACC_01678 [Paramicrosporidium saccamoebae]|uniref:Calcineurin-like phosphoesterase domain-containing protein n=1 Tax=Paramicrosporidium saccamoebae TaxID=1246581 RepID=A0A2H9TL68_9FUNG|nr:hypothetical protein PSACC_01678 [Paramicrosporidium saccamoebae]